MLQSEKIATPRGPERQPLVTCDKCGAVEAAEGLDFHEFLKELRETGWKIEKRARRGKSDYWAHFCPYCMSGGRRRRPEVDW